MKPRFDTVLRENHISNPPIKYIGRKPAASAATGYYKVHVQEQKEIIDTAFRLWFLENENLLTLFFKN